MKARSLVFDLFGDYLRYRGGEVRLRTLIALMEGFDVPEATVRVVVTRMRKEGWLATRRDGRETVYALTEAAWQLLDEGREIGFIDEDARFGVVKDAGQFRCGEAHVERHDGGADERGGEIAFEQLVGIETEVGDAVAGKDAFGEQSEGEAFDAFAEFGIRKAALAADNAGLLSVEVYCAVERSHWRKRHVHVLEIVSGEGAGRRSFSAEFHVLTIADNLPYGAAC